MRPPEVVRLRPGDVWNKPAGAKTVEIILVGADSGDGARGEAVIRSFPAVAVPDRLSVTGPAMASHGDGLALIVARFGS